MRNHYRTLQVARDAEPEVIESAYKALSRKHHPDRNTPEDSETSTRRMQAINEAYTVLRDPAKRAAYDAQLGPEDVSMWDTFLEHGLVGVAIRIAAGD